MNFIKVSSLIAQAQCLTNSLLLLMIAIFTQYKAGASAEVRVTQAMFRVTGPVHAIFTIMPLAFSESTFASDPLASFN